MALTRELYRALEDIVGTKNISEDPVLLETYRLPLTSTALHMGPVFDIYTPIGEAVLLPGNTEEVQGIVRLCNKYEIKFKASSTFWGAMGFPSEENMIQLDMRRMDRILEIDEKNMYAVVEPHVIGGTLQAEAMKVGLNTHMIGAGASCSPLASATSYLGPGPDSCSMGATHENMLGVEWVMPNGDIVRTGSLGSGLGFFCGEGPGPSLRGVIRGTSGAMGAMGVFTKCALKLYPWPGPSTLPVVGTVPAYKAELPKNFRAFTLGFPSWEAWADACHKIWDAEIGYIIHRQFNMFGRDLKAAVIKILTDPTKTLSDLEEILRDSEVKMLTEKMKRDFQIVLAGMVPGEIEWQETALNQILAETKGWKVMDDIDTEKWTLLYLIRMGHKNLNLIYGGGYDGCFGLFGPPDFGSSHIETAGKFKSEWEKKNSIVHAGGDCAMGSVGGLGGGGVCVWENFTHFDPHDKNSVDGTFEFFDATSKFGIAHGWGPGMERMNAVRRGSNGKAPSKEERMRMLSKDKQPLVYHYQQKIKEAIDPNNLGDSYYSTMEEIE